MLYCTFTFTYMYIHSRIHANVLQLYIHGNENTLKCTCT